MTGIPWTVCARPADCGNHVPDRDRCPAEQRGEYDRRCTDFPADRGNLSTGKSSVLPRCLVQYPFREKCHHLRLPPCLGGTYPSERSFVEQATNAVEIILFNYCKYIILSGLPLPPPLFFFFWLYYNHKYDVGGKRYFARSNVERYYGDKKGEQLSR